METTTTVHYVTAEPSTADLLAAGLEGDEAAWRQLVDRLQGAIWGATSRLGLSQSQAEDVFQTVWLRLIDRHETIRDPERLAGWLQQVARNEALAVIRRDSRDVSSDMLDLRESSVDGPEVDLTRRTTNELMIKGFDKLSERCKDILYLSATGVPYRDIADQLGLAIGSLGSTRRRCLDTLQSFDEVKQAMEPSS